MNTSYHCVTGRGKLLLKFEKIEDARRYMESMEDTGKTIIIKYVGDNLNLHVDEDLYAFSKESTDRLIGSLRDVPIALLFPMLPYVSCTPSECSVNKIGMLVAELLNNLGVLHTTSRVNFINVGQWINIQCASNMVLH